ncbi:MAG: hypothetical protein QF797_06900 [Alphaproteobacteria bacterium]|nr:hypothetical protein [Alphaproteobacteria bacterium]
MTESSSACTPASSETIRNSTASPGATLTSPTKRWALAAVSKTNSPLPPLTVPLTVPLRMAPGSRPVRAVESFSCGAAVEVLAAAGWFLVWASGSWRSPVKGFDDPGGVDPGGVEPGGAGGSGGAVLMAGCLQDRAGHDPVRIPG